ncbi:MAG: hypothetical protein ACTSUC_09635 [Promethearchaeota archaeon]
MLMQIPPEVQGLIKRENKSQIVVNIYFSLMVNLNQSYSDIKKIPIPMAIRILKTLDKEQKKMEADMKKHGRHRH